MNFRYSFKKGEDCSGFDGPHRDTLEQANNEELDAVFWMRGSKGNQTLGVFGMRDLCRKGSVALLARSTFFFCNTHENDGAQLFTIQVSFPIQAQRL